MNKQFEISTLLGIFGAIGLLGVALFFSSANPAGFFDIFSILIVVGGTTFVTIACFSIADFFRALKVISQSLVLVPQKLRILARSSVKLADVSKREGLLALQKYESQYPRNLFFRKYLTLIIDGLHSSQVDEIMMQEIAATAARHKKAVDIIKKAAEVAPAMGLIGTLIGLVQMLGNLEDPSSIGPAMAIALLTTLYGAVLAFVILTPLANKLEKNSNQEVDNMAICAEAVSAIAKGHGALRLELKLNSILPPLQRVKIYT